LLLLIKLIGCGAKLPLSSGKKSGAPSCGTAKAVGSEGISVGAMVG
jgi:hypothetical protein